MQTPKQTAASTRGGQGSGQADMAWARDSGNVDEGNNLHPALASLLPKNDGRNKMMMPATS